MELRRIPIKQDDFECSERFCWFEDGREEDCSHATVRTTNTRYNSGFLNSVMIGGVGTPPEYRRGGLVRQTFDEVFRLSHETKWAVSVLHPFSFSYYRKFGYERVSDHRILEFPMTALENFPRCPDFVRLGLDPTDTIEVFNRFTVGRNLSFLRYDARYYGQENGRVIYVRYRDGKPVAYLTLSPEKHFEINRSVSDYLRVIEFAFADREALIDCLGFLRMYEGELTTIRIENCAMAPELETVIRHYSPVFCRVVPDIALRVIRPDAVLAMRDYPRAPGHFTIKVEDALDLTAGTFAVEYADGKADVRRVSDSVDADICTGAPALAPLLYGCEHYTPELASYLENVRVNNPESDFFRAFSKQRCGVFEHF